MSLSLPFLVTVVLLIGLKIFWEWYKHFRRYRLRRKLEEIHRKP